MGPVVSPLVRRRPGASDATRWHHPGPPPPAFLALMETIRRVPLRTERGWQARDAVGLLTQRRALERSYYTEAARAVRIASSRLWRLKRCAYTFSVIEASSWTLIYHRPTYPNRAVANGLDTVTHEMLHALGIRDEAQTECYAMQLSWAMGAGLGVPYGYATRLSRLSLGNYFLHPPQYVDTIRCRENGQWDLLPGKNSLPWHWNEGAQET